MQKAKEFKIRQQINAYYDLHVKLERAQQCTVTNEKLLAMERNLSVYYEVYGVDGIGDLEAKLVRKHV